MTSIPKVSVLLPVYNGADYLREAIDSILVQTMPDFELIAFDDGSTDGTHALLQEMAARDGRIRVFSRPNAGIVPTLNEALAASRAPFIARMDHDDVSLPERFERQLAFLAASPDVVAVSANSLFIDPEGRPLMPTELPLVHEDIDANHLLMPPICSMSHPLLMVRREAMEQIGGYHDAYPSAEDVDLYLRLAEIGRLANIEEALLRYRLHQGSIGNSRRLEQIQSSLRATADACARRGLTVPSLPEDLIARKVAEETQDLNLRWGWWALAGGHFASARHYSGQALKEAPFDIASWRLLACTLRDTILSRHRGAH